MHQSKTIPILKPFESVLFTKCRTVDIWGGRGRGGSHLVSQIYLAKITHPAYFRGVFLRQTFGDIKDSLYREFKDRIDEHVDLGHLNINDFHFNDNGLRVLYKPTGNIIISKGVQKTSKRTAKLKSLAGATDVAIEEADELDEYDYNQLNDSLRTIKASIKVYRVFNPPSKYHWIWRDYALKESHIEGYMRAECTNPEILSIFTTYHDNVVNLDESTIRNFEAYKEKNPEYYYTVIQGLVSEGGKGRIYKGWNFIDDDEFDDVDAPIVYGLDFGYFPDPTALVAVKKVKNHLYVKEILYKTGLDDKDLREILLQLDGTIIADGGGGGTVRIANLRRNDDYGNPGVPDILTASKPPGSVNAGIELIKSKEVFITKSSKNTIFEYNEYKRRIMVNKEVKPEPEDKNNHALDALRYVVLKNI